MAKRSTKKPRLPDPAEIARSIIQRIAGEVPPEEPTLALSYAHYNYSCPHQSLTKNSGEKTTPALAIGLDDHVWTLRELVEKSM